MTNSTDTGRGSIKSKKLLINYIGMLPGGNMAEIGSCKGESTIIFASKYDIVYAIDPWEGFYKYGDGEDQYFNRDMTDIEQIFDEDTKLFRNIIKIKSKSELVVHNFENESLDFVYIDGCHTYDAVKRDIESWLPKIKNGSFIGGHDYLRSWPKIIEAVNDVFHRSPDILMGGGNWAYRV